MKNTLLTSLVLSLSVFTGCANSYTSQGTHEKISIKKIASYESKIKGASEIVAYDIKQQRVFVTNGKKNRVDVLKLTFKDNKTSLNKIASLDLNPYGTGVNSLSYKNGLLAVAVEKTSSFDSSKHLRGSVVIFDARLQHQKTIKAGYLPDMVTFNEDASLIIVANEAEPNKDYSYDPKGSIGIIDINNNYEYTDLNFFNIDIPKNVVLKKNTQAGLDLEPEYITVSKNKAYISLQENNALAIVNLDSKTIEKIVAFGFKNHSLEENALDIEEEGKILIKAYKNLYGMYQPDSIASYIVNNKTYIVSANEGDGREYGKYTNETKISKLNLSDDLKSIYKNENDLKINNEMGEENNTYTKLYTFGARSFSIWDEKGSLVYDSKNELARLTQKFEKDLFNQSKGKMDKRSGNKGVEPEALALGKINNRYYAFIGLERQNAIVVYDITNPRNAKFVQYLNTKNADLAPEGMTFVAAKNSPSKNALLIVGFENSGSTSVFEIK